MTSVLDEKRRVTVPKEVAEELGLVEGSRVAFRKRGNVVTIAKADSKDDLMELLESKPKRTGRPLPVSEREIKEIWG